MNRDEMLQKITDWAKKEPYITAVILLGSRAQNSSSDAFSDYDLSIFAETPEPFIQNEEWLTKIGIPLLCVHEKVYRNEIAFPTRLVIFEDGKKVDFSFFSPGILQELARCPILPDEYERGYTVLVDKDSYTKNMQKPSFHGSACQKPNEEEFQRIVKEFWFEAYHVAKYLKREDLILVKFRAAAIFEHFLLPLLKWHAEAKNNWKIAINPSYKNMRSWVDEHTWKALFTIFAHFDTQDSQKALESTITLFRTLAYEVAANLGYKYPQELDTRVEKLIASMNKGKPL